MDIQAIKKLREQTGVGMTDAKKALEEANGDFDKALEQMRAKGLAKAEKRGERETRAGVVGTYNHDGRIGVAIEVNCETDFVARNDIFTSLVKDLSMQVAASNPENVTELLTQPYIKDPSLTVEDFVKEHNAKLGENIVIRRFSRIELGEVEK